MQLKHPWPCQYHCAAFWKTVFGGLYRQPRGFVSPKWIRAYAITLNDAAIRQANLESSRRLFGIRNPKITLSRACIAFFDAYPAKVENGCYPENENTDRVGIFRINTTREFGIRIF